MKTDFIQEWGNQSGFSYFSLILALASLLVLCVPFVGYAAIVLSVTGLLLGSYDIYRYLLRNEGQLGFVLAGIAACLVASILAFMPWVSR